MAVKVDARIKEIYDPTKYIQLLKGKIGDCSKTMNRLVKYMKDTKIYDGYVQIFGTPEIPEATFDGEDEEAAIMASMASAGQLRGGDAEMEVDDEVMDEDPTAPAQLRKVRQEWNQELVAHQRAAGQELETLRLRHLQDLEEARRAGADEGTLARLRAQHDDELGMLKEQNQALRSEILRQKAKDEAKALLSNAFEHQAEVLGSVASGTAAQQDNARISEMVVHLQETCESKDEVLVRLFDLICLRESELQDLEQNVTAIAAAMAPAGAGDATILKAENQRLKADLARKDQHIEALKGLAASSSGGSGGGLFLPPTAGGGGGAVVRTPSPTAHPKPSMAPHQAVRTVPASALAANAVSPMRQPVGVGTRHAPAPKPAGNYVSPPTHGPR